MNLLEPNEIEEHADVDAELSEGDAAAPRYGDLEGTGISYKFPVIFSSSIT